MQHLVALLAMVVTVALAVLGTTETTRCQASRRSPVVMAAMAVLAD